MHLLHPNKPHEVESSFDDFPVFLANVDWRPAPERSSRRAFNWRDRLDRFSTQMNGALSTGRADLQDRWRSLREYAQAIPSSWQEERSREIILRGALVALIAPLAVLAMQDQPRQLAESDRSAALSKAASPATAATPSPAFNLEDRLAFTDGLRDRMASHAIAQSLEQSSSQRSPAEPSSPTMQARTVPPSADLPTQARKEGMLETETAKPLSPPPLATDDRKWSLPFGSKSYLPTELSATSDDSFLSEIAMADIMSRRATSAYEVPAPAVASVETPKREAVKRNKLKQVAQKKRPAKVNQMTAAAAPLPPAVRVEPNLPPPPILFFLGAPPPQQP